MAVFSRILTAVALAFALSACAGAPSIAPTPGLPPFTLESFFVGQTVGRGAFVSSIAGVNRPLTVKTRGTLKGNTLTLVEDFFYDDGERDRKTWRFTRVAPGVYEGRREDVLGVADVRQVGDTVQLNYSADIPNKKDGSVTRLTFADTIALVAPDKALNRATVSKFGIGIGIVDITFTKR